MTHPQSVIIPIADPIVVTLVRSLIHCLESIKLIAGITFKPSVSKTEDWREESTKKFNVPNYELENNLNVSIDNRLII